MRQPATARSSFIYVLGWTAVAGFSSCCAEQTYYDMLIDSCAERTGGYYDSLIDSCAERAGGYYDSLVERAYGRATARRWGFWSRFEHECVTEAFDGCGSCKPLSSILFGSGTTLGDVFLGAKLAGEGRLRTVAFCEGHVLGLPGQQNAGTTGIMQEDDPNKQWIAHIAGIELSFGAIKEEFQLTLGGIHRFFIPKTEKLSAVIGVEVPIIKETHQIDLKFLGPGLYMTKGSSESSIEHFFRLYNSIEDFFCSTALGSDLKFAPSQTKVGVGDVTIFGLVEFTQYTHGRADAHVGLDVVLPTSDKRDISAVWPIELGNGGATLVGLFAYSLFATSKWYVHPLIFARVRISNTFEAQRRLARQVTDQSELSIPTYSPLGTVFKIVGDIDEASTTSILLGGDPVCTQIKLGTEFLLRVGNYFHVRDAFQLGLFYDYEHDGEFEMCVKDPSVTNAIVPKTFSQTSHTVSWQVAYAVNEHMHIYGGSEHVVSGRNTVKSHNFFVFMISSV